MVPVVTMFNRGDAAWIMQDAFQTPNSPTFCDGVYDVYRTLFSHIVQAWYSLNIIQACLARQFTKQNLHEIAMWNLIPSLQMSLSWKICQEKLTGEHSVTIFHWQFDGQCSSLFSADPFRTETQSGRALRSSTVYSVYMNSLWTSCVNSKKPLQNQQCRSLSFLLSVRFLSF